MIVFYPDVKGQVGVGWVNINPPSNPLLIWVHIDANGALVDFKKFDKGSGTWKSLGAVDIVDNLFSFSSTSALSANQGRTLNALITSNRNAISNVEDDVEGLQQKSEKDRPGGYLGISAQGLVDPKFLPAVAYIPAGSWDASTGAPPSPTPQEGEIWSVSVPGTTNLNGNSDWSSGDFVYYAQGQYHYQPGYNAAAYNGLDQTSPGFYLDARVGPLIQVLLDQLTSDLASASDTIIDQAQQISDLENQVQELQNNQLQKQQKIIRIKGTIGNDKFQNDALSSLSLDDIDVFVSGQLLQENWVQKLSSDTLSVPPGNDGNEILIIIYPQ